MDTLKSKLLRKLSSEMIIRLKPEDYPNLTYSIFRNRIHIQFYGIGYPKVVIGPKSLNTLNATQSEVVEVFTELGIRKVA